MREDRIGMGREGMKHSNTSGIDNDDNVTKADDKG